MYGAFNWGNDGVFALRKRKNDKLFIKCREIKKKELRQNSQSSARLPNIQQPPSPNTQKRSEYSYSKIEKTNLLNCGDLCVTPEKKKIFGKVSAEDFLITDVCIGLKLPSLKKVKRGEQSSQASELKEIENVGVCTVATNTSHDSLEMNREELKKQRSFVGRNGKKLIQILDNYPVSTTPDVKSIQKDIKISSFRHKNLMRFIKD